MSKIPFQIFIAIFFLSTPLISCKHDSSGRRTSLPNVTGTAGEVAVVLDKAVWDEPIGKAFADVLKTDFPMLPQKEPMFDPVWVPTPNFSGVFKSHRNVILVKVGNEHPKAGMAVQRDVWATPQLVITFVGPTYPSIEKLLKQEASRLLQQIAVVERERIISTTAKVEEKELGQLLEKKFGFSLTLPKGYVLNKQTDNFVWIAYEAPSTSQGIFVYTYPYEDKNTFTPEFLIEKRDSFLEASVPGPTDGSYMITFDEIPPLFSQFNYNERYFAELRGLWDVHAHPMGGPFVSLSTVDQSKNMVVTVEAYVYAPRFKKRNYLRQVEALLYTLKFKEN